MGDLMKTKCLQCGKELGPEVFLGVVCSACCRKNHAAVMGRRVPQSKKRGKAK